MTDQERKAMEMALEALFEAQDEIREWGGYASDYFQKKHDLPGSIAKLQPVINTLRTALEHPEPDWTTDTPVPPFKYLDFAEYKGTGESVKIKHTLAQGEQDHGFDRTASHMTGEYVDASDTSSTYVDKNEKRKHEPVAWTKVSDGLPKSGVTVLACYRNSLGNLRRIRAHWIAAKTEESNGDYDEFFEYDEETDTYYAPEGWYECIDNWGDYSSVRVCEGEVTHWMPLPPAPDEQLRSKNT